MDRRALGSWLSGPQVDRDETPQEYPGQRLGMPRSGSGSLAGWGRRIGALAVDWALSWAIVAGFGLGGGFATLAVFAVENVLLVGTLGFTVGKRLFGIGVRRVDGGRPSFPAVLIRTVLLCLAVPAMITDRDGRGLHDKAVGTAVIRL
ncbi:hypothetical protein TH66_15275 [Carbonactinospora thermoautotrophica]|uniref:RDD domain-containing protein n=2 Tax=Carbonactinospora thermoautotrophica TaxID=1469144 RepID=A0A132N7L5_9ACTN|nr:RDD family protein [Carbonactinospora thermoautotrophica]KWX00226.1 hypothetical protein TH66_15275 [Carbonactinospora thermoautotrophica]KWX06109.1 hypothetical protein TR74_22925 [Carbonactinospora thermoautotrophica]